MSFHKRVFVLENTVLVLKLSVYRYDPLHIYDEISMFVTFSSKMVFVKTYVYMKLQKSKRYFQNENSFKKTHLNLVCEVYDT